TSPPSESATAGQRLIPTRSEVENVGALVSRQTPRLLGRHVTCRPPHLTRFCLGRGIGSGRFGVQQLCKTEVEDFYLAVARDDYVLRLEVAVHDAAVVRSHQTMRNLQR